MSTEYRRGIPSTAHIEAATRLGLLWGDNYSLDRRWHFEIRDGVFHSDFESSSVSLGGLRSGPGFWMPPAWVDLRPIRPDGTPVDWEVLDQEVARVGQPATVTPTQPEPVLNEAALRSLILNLPNVAAITSRIERGSRQRDRYIVRVRLVDPNVPLDRALAAQIPRNVHVHCEGRGDGGQRGVGGTASSIFSPTGNREDAVAPPIQELQRVNVVPRRFADVRPDRHGWRWWRIVGAPDAGIIGARFEAMREQWRWLAMSDGAAPTGNLIGSHSWTHSGVWDARTVIPTDEQGNPVSWESIGHTVGSVSPAQNAATENEVQRITQVVASVTQQALQQTLGSPVTVSPTTGHVEPPISTPSRFALVEIDDGDPAAERIRLEQAAERQRLAELRQRLAAKRAAQPAEGAPTITITSRFDLIEPDPQADPAASIRAWEARLAAAKVCPVAVPPRIAKPGAEPRRPAIEVVDAEVDGLSRVDVVAALFGRVLNGGC